MKHPSCAFIYLAVACLPLLPSAQAFAADEAAIAETPRPVVSEIADLRSGLPMNFVGTVSAKVEVNLGFPMIGTVAERLVGQGETVSRGDVLARLDPEDLDSGVRAAEAGVAVADAQADSARDVRDRAKELAARGVGAQARLDDAERALVAAEARLEQARAALARARDMLALATLKAPQDGVITAVYKDPGATLAAGEPVLQLSGTNEREIVIDLGEEDAAALKPGTAFVARLVANRQISADVVLERIDPVAEKNTRTRRAHLRLDDPPAAFRLGALASVAPVALTGSAIVIPQAALLETEDGTAVWVVDRTGNTVHRKPVGIAARIGGYAVIASGLSAGDEVVTRGIHSLQEGQSVGRRISQ